MTPKMPEQNGENAAPLTTLEQQAFEAFGAAWLRLDHVEQAVKAGEGASFTHHQAIADMQAKAQALKITILLDAHAALLAAHAEALERERWIPVSERLPEEGQDVLFTAEARTVYGFRVNDAWYRMTGRTYEAGSVSHWRHLPAPPAPASAEGGAE